MDCFFASEGLLATLAIIAIFATLAILAIIATLAISAGREALRRGLLHFLEVDVGDVVVGGGGVGVG